MACREIQRERGMMFAPKEPTGDGFEGEKGPIRGWDKAGGNPRGEIM